MRRARTDPTKLDLTYPCPKCGYKIPPREIVLLDSERIKCPQCGEVRVYGKKA